MGTYEKLYDMGALDVAEGLLVQPPALLWEAIQERWGRPLVIVCDRFRLAELKDAIKAGARIEPRVGRWSEQSFDIRALRKMAKDGPLSVDAGSRLLIQTSLARAMVKNDDAGNVQQVKQGANNTGRDDVSAALVMAAGGVARDPKPSRVRSLGLVALDRDSWACVQCGKYGRLEVDHVQPLEDGGELYTLQNLQSLCRSCHITKSKNERSIKVDSPDVRAWKHLITESLQDMV